ncbi:MAG: GntR family transcriptional regulator [Alphaproteobacteria bacterium]|nr:GntR family transcriptional regulator [Alphaproteobacteria bacterium]
MTTTLHSRVEDDILNRIQSGDWHVGDRLPKEEDLAAQLGVSRSTLRIAFASLERKGVLQRKKRAGTRIISDRPTSRFSMVTGGISEVLSLGRDTRFDISSTRSVADDSVAVLSGLESETGHWLEITGTRKIDENEPPFNWSQIYVTGRYAGIAPALGKGVTSVFEVIEDAFGTKVSRVSQKVLAIACPDRAAKAMGLAEGDPVLQIVARLYDQDDRLFEVSSATFDPERFQVNTDVRVE